MDQGSLCSSSFSLFFCSKFKLILAAQFYTVFSLLNRETGRHCVLEIKNLTYMRWERNLSPKQLTRFRAPWIFVWSQKHLWRRWSGTSRWVHCHSPKPSPALTKRGTGGDLGWGGGIGDWEGRMEVDTAKTELWPKEIGLSQTSATRDPIASMSCLCSYLLAPLIDVNVTEPKWIRRRYYNSMNIHTLRISIQNCGALYYILHTGQYWI